MEIVKGMVSIIAGCYNVEEWLRKKQLSCIIGQSYKNLEIILVDDGSTDGTRSMLDALSSKDNRIRVITKDNGGPGSARNAGLDAAKGEYIWFYDVDDEVAPRLVEKNVEWMKKYNTDLNIFSFKAITPWLHLSEDVIFENRLVENNSTLHDIFLDRLFFVRYGNGFVWNKFYRRSFLQRNRIRFGDQRIQQDELFNLEIYPLIERVYISSELLYNYFIYEKGNTRSHYIPKRIDIYISVYECINRFSDIWKLQDARLKDYTMNRLYGGMTQSLVYNTFHPESPHDNKGKKQEFLQILNHPTCEACMEYMERHNDFNIEQRLFFFSFRKHFFTLTRMLRYCFNIMRKAKGITGTEILGSRGRRF